jgi:putative flippase GtrA
VNYILCVYVVFHAENQSTKQMVLFIVTSLMGLGLNQLVIWCCIDLLGIWYMFSKVVASAIVMIWNYFTKRFILHGHA